MLERTQSCDSNSDRYAWAEPGAYLVRSGVYRIPLPLPGDGLRAVNVYALIDGSGLVLIDSGWALDQACDALRNALGELGFPLTAIRRILVTHAHRDHYTLATRLRRQYKVPVVLGSGERGYLEAVRSGDAHRNRENQMHRFGAPAQLVGSSEKIYPREHDRHEPADWTDPDEWLNAPSTVRLESRQLQVIPTPGHTSGHIVFVDRENGMLFAGDHILPTITPSIGFEPRPSVLPLREYLDSLRLVQELPDMTLLPGHGHITEGFHSRVEELLAHHAERLDHAASTVNSNGVTVYQVAAQLPWTRRQRRFTDLDAGNQLLALIETSAHLELLVALGRLSAAGTAGPVHYVPAGHAPSENQTG
jgi:glyoxylase-like metal-dependent hydrolase (beta-lactamase superfamily II)